MTNANPQTNWIPRTDSFGARLALVRWRMGWNVAEAERECGLTQNTWAGYEGGREPRRYVEIVNRIVLRTSVDKMWLMTGEGSPVGPTWLEHVTSTVEYGRLAEVIPMFGSAA